MEKMYFARFRYDKDEVFCFDIFEGMPEFYDEHHGFLGYPITMTNGLQVVNSFGMMEMKTIEPYQDKDLNGFLELFGKEKVIMRISESLDEIIENCISIFASCSEVYENCWLLDIDQEAIPCSDCLPVIRIFRLDGSTEDINTEKYFIDAEEDSQKD